MTERQLLLTLLDAQRRTAMALAFAGQGPAANATLTTLEMELTQLLYKENYVNENLGARRPPPKEWLR